MSWAHRQRTCLELFAGFIYGQRAPGPPLAARALSSGSRNGQFCARPPRRSTEHSPGQRRAQAFARTARARHSNRAPGLAASCFWTLEPAAQLQSRAQGARACAPSRRTEWAHAPRAHFLQLSVGRCHSSAEHLETQGAQARPALGPLSSSGHLALVEIIQVHHWRAIKSIALEPVGPIELPTRKGRWGPIGGVCLSNMAPSASASAFASAFAFAFASASASASASAANGRERGSLAKASDAAHR